MKYLAPNLLTPPPSITLNTIPYTVDYYAPPTLLTGVTDEAYPEYSLASTYAIGTYVKIDALKKIFRAAAAVAINLHPLENPTLWIDYGPLNYYRMLATDEFVNGQTTGTNAVMEFNFSRCDTFAFVAADFISVTIELIDNNTATTVFSATHVGRDYGALSYSDFYYTDYKSKSRVVISGLEWMPNSKLRLTFSGAVSIGAVVHGTATELGLTLYGTALKFQDTSKIANSSITGVRSVIRYGSVRVITADITIDTIDFNLVANKIEAIIGKNVLWIPTDVDKFSETVSLGYIEDINLPITNPMQIGTTTTIIGVL